MASKYAGKVKHAGVQKIEAPFATDKAKKGKVKEGNDLRVKNGK